MSLKLQLMGNGNKETVDVVKCPSGRLNTLVVSTKELTTYTYKTIQFSNATYGQNMNQDFATGVVTSTENVHNGEDDTYWTASTIVGNINDFDFSSTDVAHTGAQSIDATSSEGGDQFQLLNSSEISPTAYDRLNGWVYIDGLWALPDDGVRIVFYNTNTGVEVSDAIDLDNYVTGTNINVWQNFIIPLSDFGIFTDDYNAIRFTTLEDGAPPDYYLDDIKLEEINVPEGSNVFSIAPRQPYWWYIDSFQIILADAYDSTVTDGTVPGLPYDSLLGVSLTNGILYSRIQGGETEYSTLLYNLLDFMEQPGTDLSGYGSDGTNTWLTMRAVFDKEPIRLRSELEDEIRFTINDDLSGLLRFRIFAEIRQIDTSREFV